MKNKYLTFLIFLCLYFLFSLNPVQALSVNAEIYITQVQISGGKSKTNEDFVELFNPSEKQFNLKGFRLVKRVADSESDSTIKVWTKNTYVLPKTFFLWANSGFGTISAKPDLVSSVSLSEDSGVALRFGENNTGEIYDSIAWGSSNNGFKNVSKVNPKANQSLQRKDWYAKTSEFTIGNSNPHNSLVKDVTAAFQQSQNVSSSVMLPPQKKLALKPKTKVENILPIVPTVQGTTTEVQFTPKTKPQSEALPLYTHEQVKTENTSPAKYLILSLGALTTLVFLVYTFWFKKTKE